MGNNYVKQLGIKPEGKIGTREFNAIWDKYAEKDKTMKRKNAIKFLRDFSTAVNVKCDDEMIRKLMEDAGVNRNDKIITKDAFIGLFFANVESNPGHAALTRSIMNIRKLSVRSRSDSPLPSTSEREPYNHRSNSERLQVTPENSTPIKSKIPDTKIAHDLVVLFDKYSSLGDSPDTMYTEAYVSFLKDLGLSPMDVELLVIGYHLKEDIIGIFQKDKFVTGFAKLNMGSLESIKANLPSLRQSVEKPETLKELFRYAHHFYREKEVHKTIPLDTAVYVIGSLLPSRPFRDPFQRFIPKQKEYKAINIDQWINIYDFITTVSDLNEYSETSSWPYLIDLFVEWLKEGHTGESEEETKKQDNEDGENTLLDCKYYKL
jgi:hypothetical protein